MKSHAIDILKPSCLLFALVLVPLVLNQAYAEVEVLNPTHSATLRTVPAAGTTCSFPFALGAGMGQLSLRPTFDSSFSCFDRAYMRWDTSTIPDGSTINEIRLIVTPSIGGINANRDCEARSLQFEPQLNLFNETSNDIKNGTIYSPNLNGWCKFVSLTPTSIILGNAGNTQALIDLQNLLPQNWFGIGFSYVDETRDSLEHSSTRWFSPQLQVTYTPPLGTLKITKVTTGGDDDTFDFTVTGPTSYNPSINTVGGIGVNGPTTVIPGTYTIQEANPTGWELTDAVCNDGSSSFNVDTISGIQIDSGDNIECTFENSPSIVEETFSAEKDSFLKAGDKNTNEGANEVLQIQGSGKYRTVVAFNQTAIDQAAGGLDVINATLRLYIEDNANNWSPSGRTIDIHRVTSDWTEGNGWNVGNNIRGTDSGVTWSCAIDTDISNPQANCNPEWDGGSFVSTATDSMLITNGLEGQFIEFDVTADVQAFLDGTSNYGWIIKKTQDSQSGSLDFTSREGTTNNPELVIFFG